MTKEELMTTLLSKLPIGIGNIITNVQQKLLVEQLYELSKYQIQEDCRKKAIEAVESVEEYDDYGALDQAIKAITEALR